MAVVRLQHLFLGDELLLDAADALLVHFDCKLVKWYNLLEVLVLKLFNVINVPHIKHIDHFLCHAIILLPWHFWKYRVVYITIETLQSITHILLVHLTVSLTFFIFTTLLLIITGLLDTLYLLLLLSHQCILVILNKLLWQWHEILVF